MTRKEEILDELYNHTIDGDDEPVIELTNEGLSIDMTPMEILFDGLIPALEEVGRLFESGEFFVPEMLVAANAMKGAMEILRPLIAETGAQPVGKFVMGTVKGDIHDIGKDIVVFMLDVNGFEVYDLGIDVPVQAFVDKIAEVKPPVVALSGFLTLSYEAMKETVGAITAAGLRDGVKIMVGGGTVDDQVCRYAGADAFGLDAMAAVSLAKQWTGAN